MTERELLCPEALKAARKRANGKRGFTQAQLAEEIGCSKDTVSRWERGETSRVRAHLREPLCEVLGVDWDTLTTPPGPEAAPRAVWPHKDAAVGFAPRFRPPCAW